MEWWIFENKSWDLVRWGRLILMWLKSSGESTIPLSTLYSGTQGQHFFSRPVSVIQTEPQCLPLELLCRYIFFSPTITYSNHSEHTAAEHDSEQHNESIMWIPEHSLARLEFFPQVITSDTKDKSHTLVGWSTNGVQQVAKKA